MRLLNALCFALVLLFAQELPAQAWRVATPYNGTINDIVFTDALTGYACGQGAGTGNCVGTGFITKTIDGGATWTRMETASTTELTRIFFKDAFTGWAIGNLSTVMKTTDGGVSWALQSSGVGTGLNDLFFVDNNTGFLCGPNGALRKTINGGANFLFATSGVTTTLYGVHFVNTNLGFIVGDNGVVRKTTNGGTSFSSIYSGTDHFRDVHFFSDSVGFVMSSNKILKTIDGGSNWTTFNADPSWIMTRMQFISSNTGFVIGDNGLLLKTTDGGNTWNQLSTNTTEFLRTVFFTDENTGYFGHNHGNIHQSTDGGVSWNSILSGLSEELYGIHFRNRTLGLAVGKYGGIYRTENGGLNWTNRVIQSLSTSLNCVRWLTDEKAIAVGANGNMLKSDDTGLHWYPLQTGVTGHMHDIHVVDSSTVYLTFGTGKLMKTTDGCLSWDTTLYTGSTFALTGVYFIDADTGYACVQSEIYRTYNGGSTWTLKNDSVQPFTSFNDIFFTSRDTGYVAGTFGGLYRTINGGEWWHRMYPPSPSNADINEMQFLSNDTGYFAGSTSQRATFNGGVHFGVLPTACLATSGETHSINIPESGYGYCVGGLFGLLHTWQQDRMLGTYLQDSIFCSGSRIFVGYLASGLLLSTQIIDVQLSDATGDFSSPTIIGTFQLYTPMTDPSGIATCALPPGANGNGYRIRVVCNSPVLISPDNGYDITIQSGIAPVINLSLHNTKTCVNDTLRFAAEVIGGGSNPEFSWSLDNQQLDWQAATIAIDTLHGSHVLNVSMSSSLSCATSSAGDSVQFELFQNPVVDAGSDQFICEGTNTVIGAATNSGPLQWFPSTGLDDDTIAMPLAAPFTTEQYILSSTNMNGCIGRDTMRVWVNQLPTIDVAGNLQLCAGDSTLLTATSFGVNPVFSWSPSGIISTTDSGFHVYAFPTTDATLYIAVVDDNLCVNSDSVNLQVFPAAAIPDLSLVINLLVVTVNTQNLEWYLNNSLITGFTSDTMHNPGIGIYQVKATDPNGCIAWSQPVTILIAGTGSIRENIVATFVTGDVFHLRVTGTHSKKTELNLFDVSGRLILTKTVLLDNAGSGETEIKNISKGIYFSRIKIEDAERTLKIIVE